MENKAIKNIKDAQSQLSKLLEGQNKDVIDAIAKVSATLDKAIETSTERDKEYQEMKDDYIKMVKNVNFSSPPQDIQEDQEVTLEEIVAKHNKNKEK